MDTHPKTHKKMAFGFNTVSAGDILPELRWRSAAGRIFEIERKQDANGAWFKDETDLTQDCVIIVDMQSWTKGYINFKPFNRISVSIEADVPLRPAKPENVEAKDWYSSFVSCRVMRNPQSSDLYDMQTTSFNAMNSWQEMYDAATSAPEAQNTALVPVFRLVGTESNKTKNGTYYRPVWKLLQWINRPAAMDEYGKQAEPEPVVQQIGSSGLPAFGSSAVQNGQFSQPALSSGNAQNPPPAQQQYNAPPAQAAMPDDDDLPF